MAFIIPPMKIYLEIENNFIKKNYLILQPN